MAKAAGTIDTSYVLMRHTFPGHPDPFLRKPMDFGVGGVAGDYSHNVASPKYQPGTVLQVFDKTNNGYAWLTYLQLIFNNATAAVAARSVCGIDYATRNTGYNYYKVTNSAAEILSVILPQCAIALSAMTNAYWGWFWTGGVCPESFITALAGTIATYSDPAAIPIGPFQIGANAANDLAIQEPLSAGTTGTIAETAGWLIKAATAT
jgi:hypothetical protein